MMLAILLAVTFLLGMFMGATALAIIAMTFDRKEKKDGDKKKG